MKPNDYKRMICRSCSERNGKETETLHYGFKEPINGVFRSLNCIHCVPYRKQPDFARVRWDLIRKQLEQCLAGMSTQEEFDTLKGMIVEKEHYLQKFNQIVRPMKEAV